MVSDSQLKFPEVNKSLNFILSIAENVTQAERDCIFIKSSFDFWKVREGVFHHIICTKRVSNKNTENGKISSVRSIMNSP